MVLDSATFVILVTAAFLIVLSVGVVRFARRRWTSSHTPFPDVGSAPSSADPIAVQWWSDDGLWRFYRELPPTTDPDEQRTTE